jgi:hypothetical protein
VTATGAERAAKELRQIGWAIESPGTGTICSSIQAAGMSAVATKGLKMTVLRRTSASGAPGSSASMMAVTNVISCSSSQPVLAAKTGAAPIEPSANPRRWRGSESYSK